MTMGTLAVLVSLRALNTRALKFLTQLGSVVFSVVSSQQTKNARKDRL